jgi:hypothetical protein
MHLGSKAVSPLIASVLVAFFGVITLGVALGVVNPTFRRAQDTSAVNDQFQTLQTLNAAVKEVASEPDGSRRVVPITVTAGALRVNSTYDWLYFEYEPLETLGISGTRGDIHIDQGLEFADYFSSYADGAMASPVWTNTSGQAVASSGAYSITNGTAYHNVSTLENWKFSATITNVSGNAGGEVFVLPTNPESLVGYWTMDEASGGMAYDYSGNRNNGTLTNMNTTGNATSGWNSTDCKFGGCLKFDGVNDKIIFGNAALTPSAMTVSFWWKKSGAAGGASTTYHHVLRYLNGAPGSNANGIYIFSAGDRALFRLTIDGVLKDVSITGMDMTGWNYITATWNGTHSVGYLNGASVAVTPASGTLATGTTPLELGRIADYIVNGAIDEVMIFNRSLSADEVAALYETSAKKLSGAGGTQSITTKTPNLAIMLSNPAGATKFDSIEVTSGAGKLTLMVPYTTVELNGTLRLQKGEHRVQIRHMATNATTNKPIIELTAV